jgi:O-methyltransferase involved in polyketide biosynthesis
MTVNQEYDSYGEVMASNSVSPDKAQRWLDRWDRQQEIYIADREERFTVIGDVVEQVVGRPDPVVVDLGTGPGSLAVRLLDRLPAATVIGVDADPLLLGLARAAYGDRPGLRLVDHDLRKPGWVEALDLPRPPDAVVSTTALHWLTRAQLADVYWTVAGLLAGGGMFVNGDHLAEPAGFERLSHLQGQIAHCRATRAGAGGGEDWSAWWAAVGQDPELTNLLGQRGPQPIEHTVAQVPTIADHQQLLRTAGFGQVGTVWQQGDDRILVALS